MIILGTSLYYTLLYLCRVGVVFMRHVTFLTCMHKTRTFAKFFYY